MAKRGRPRKKETKIEAPDQRTDTEAAADPNVVVPNRADQPPQPTFDSTAGSPDGESNGTTADGYSEEIDHGTTDDVERKREDLKREREEINAYIAQRRNDIAEIDRHIAELIKRRDEISLALEDDYKPTFAEQIRHYKEARKREIERAAKEQKHYQEHAAELREMGLQPISKRAPIDQALARKMRRPSDRGQIR